MQINAPLQLHREETAVALAQNSSSPSQAALSTQVSYPRFPEP